MSKSNARLSEFFTDNHRACDEAWAAVEEAAGKKGAADLGATWGRFEDMMRLHFRWEEEVVFPAFENATGMHGGGPTAVMRFEHTQMRGLLDQMKRAVDGGNAQAVLDQGDTLLMLIQQHNAKEEAMLYPMADQVLGRDWPDLQKRLPPQ